MIRDKMMNYENLEGLNKKCKTCNKRDHDLFACPNVHFVPRKDFIIKRYLFSKPQLERSKITRFNKKKGNVLKFLSKIQESASFFEPSNLNHQEEGIFEENDDNYSELDVEDNQELMIPLSKIKKNDSSDQNEIVLKEGEESISPTMKNKQSKDLMNGFKIPSSECLDSKQGNNNNSLQKNNKFNNSKKIPSFSTINANNVSVVKNNQNSDNTNWENGFERMHIFSQYFCNNNSNVVLKSYENYIAKKMTQINKLKNIKRRRTLINTGSPVKMNRSKFFHKDNEGDSKKSMNLLSGDCKSFIKPIEKSIILKYNEGNSFSSIMDDKKK